MVVSRSEEFTFHFAAEEVVGGEVRLGGLDHPDALDGVDVVAGSHVFRHPEGIKEGVKSLL